MSAVKVSNQIKEQLESMKDRNGHKSIDSVIRASLSNPCKGTNCVLYWNCMEYGCPKFKKMEAI